MYTADGSGLHAKMLRRCGHIYYYCSLQASMILYNC